jgi:hypothetical protein
MVARPLVTEERHDALRRRLIPEPVFDRRRRAGSGDELVDATGNTQAQGSIGDDAGCGGKRDDDSGAEPDPAGALRLDEAAKLDQEVALPRR